MKLTAAILGATGVVGQRFARRLAQHPNFQLIALAASEKNVGKSYAEACEWRLGGPDYAGLGEMRLLPASPKAIKAQVVFSALDADVAKELEPAFAQAASWVFSNAAAYRQEEDVPLLIPELNASHLELIQSQQKKRGWKGAIITNPNCTAVALLSALGPLHKIFGAEAIIFTSMQAISGAGYPGVAALDVFGNVIPFIKNEEEKAEFECKKILGSLEVERIHLADIALSAHCNRVPVIDGHTIAMSLKLKSAPTPKEVLEALRSFKADTEGLDLPSKPRRYLYVHEEVNRPQPLRDVEAEGGMACHVGRIRACPILGIKLVALAHNAERGAAGASILNAELALARGYLK